jgi:hypothetical protein
MTLKIDPLLLERPSNAVVRPCPACTDGVGTHWPSYPKCWKCGQPGSKFFEPAAPAPKPAAELPPEAPVVAELMPALPATPAPPLARPRKTRMQKHMEFVARVDRDIRKESAKIVMDTFAASEVPDDGSRPDGWSDRKWRTARDARLSDREAPAYIRHAARMLESYRRSEALEDKKPAPTLNCDIQVYVRQEVTQQYNYEVIESKDE